MSQDGGQASGQCHCGAVRFEVELADGLEKGIRCTCSYCRMKGSVMAFAELAKLRFTAGEDLLSLYQFNTGTARHYFCSRCGIHTHHQRRSDPSKYAINVACLDGISPFDFAEVTVLDGENHPGDTGTQVRVAGVLRFTPAG